jgi:hypothetical protein
MKIVLLNVINSKLCHFNIIILLTFNNGRFLIFALVVISFFRYRHHLNDLECLLNLQTVE